MAREWYTDESWQKVLDAHVKCTETKAKHAEARREEYYKNPKLCKQCGEPISYEKRRKCSFCNSSCSASYTNLLRTKKERFCIQCRKKLSIRGGKDFCSHGCEVIYKYESYITEWLSGKISGSAPQIPSKIEKWIKSQKGEQCWQCGWKEVSLFTKRIPLHIHHIDGHYMNNRPENLMLLCPNCHSLTGTHGSLNNGNGRKERYLK